MGAESQAMVAMPRYQSHKKVWALKIKAVERYVPTIAELDRILNGTPGDGDSIGGFITPEDAMYSRFPVPSSYMQKHSPEAGGYYVQYEDGYVSFSPAAAFEEGYTRI